jgi:hypothetical protein
MEAGADDYVDKAISAGRTRGPRPGESPTSRARRRGTMRRTRRSCNRHGGPRSQPRRGRDPSHTDRVQAAHGPEPEPRTPTHSQHAVADVWGPSYTDARETLRAHMANLRRKIEPADGGPLIHTNRGVGYRLADMHPEAAEPGRSAD